MISTFLAVEPLPPLLSMANSEAMVGDLSPSSVSSFGYGSKHSSSGEPIFIHSARLHDPISHQSLDFQ
ncbi:hypothetical protein KSP39_PZI005816 [Platanthera zijinensis]|uniref:Uncharacterized protein n=1 Tax=Platanthera zijinensis TaxID=2320716 RepID=A0AAP0BUJ1_9ASPA